MAKIIDNESDLEQEIPDWYFKHPNEEILAGLLGPEFYLAFMEHGGFQHLHGDDFVDKVRDLNKIKGD